MSKEEIFGFINGFMTIMTVIFLLNPFTGVDISLNNLRKALEDDPKNGTVLDHVKNDNERKLLYTKHKRKSFSFLTNCGHELSADKQHPHLCIPLL
jgi:hypothetical protein